MVPTLWPSSCYFHTKTTLILLKDSSDSSAPAKAKPVAKEAAAAIKLALLVESTNTCGTCGWWAVGVWVDG